MSASAPPAIGAVVVEELDQGDLARRVAEHDLVLGVEDRLGGVLDRLALGDLVGGVLLALQRIDRIADDLGIGDQVVADDALELRALIAGEPGNAGEAAGDGRRVCRYRGARRKGDPAPTPTT